MSSNTIHDIARIAGVSSATVSRVINNPKLVSSETRARIEAVISDLNYQPNAHAVELVRSKSQRKTLGDVQSKLAGRQLASLTSHRLELESLRSENSRLRSVVASLSLEIAKQRRRRA